MTAGASRARAYRPSHPVSRKPCANPRLLPLALIIIAARSAAKEVAPAKKLQTASTAPPTAARCLRVSDDDFDRWFVEHYDQSGRKPGRKATGVDCSNACSDPSSEHHSWCVGFEFKDTEKGTCELYEGCTQQQAQQSHQQQG